MNRRELLIRLGGFGGGLVIGSSLSREEPLSSQPRVVAVKQLQDLQERNRSQYEKLPVDLPPSIELFRFERIDVDSVGPVVFPITIAPGGLYIVAGSYLETPFGVLKPMPWDFKPEPEAEIVDVNLFFNPHPDKTYQSRFRFLRPKDHPYLEAKGSIIGGLTDVRSWPEITQEVIVAGKVATTHRMGILKRDIYTPGGEPLRGLGYPVVHLRVIQTDGAGYHNNSYSRFNL